MAFFKSSLVYVISIMDRFRFRFSLFFCSGKVLMETGFNAADGGSILLPSSLGSIEIFDKIILKSDF